MLLLILWSIVGTLAVSQGLVVLFLIRTRGNNLALTREILLLQDRIRQLDEALGQQASVSTRVDELEKIVTEKWFSQKHSAESRGRVIRLKAVGGQS